MSDVNQSMLDQAMSGYFTAKDNAVGRLRDRLVGEDLELFDSIMDLDECRLRMIEGLVDLDRMVREVQQKAPSL